MRWSIVCMYTYMYIYICVLENKRLSDVIGMELLCL